MANGFVVVHGAGGREDHAAGMVALGKEVPQIITGNRFDAGWRAKNGAARWLARISGVVHQIKDQVVGTVARARDLLENHFALFLEFVVGEGRILQNVGQDAEGYPFIALEDACEVSGRLQPGGRIEIAADGFDLLGDIPRRARQRALERHVLQKVREAVLRGQFVAGASIHPNSKRGGLKVRHGFGDDD